MYFFTRLALQRRSVTLLLIAMVLVGGAVTYGTLPVELFPEIEFPLITVSTFYPSANPDAVVRDVTEPIENAISGIDGVEDIQSVSSENRSLVLANFKFGTDMTDAERAIVGNLGGIQFPTAVAEPKIGRINVDEFPVLQLSVLGGLDTTELQQLVESQVVPAILGVDGVSDVEVTGGVQRTVLVTVDPSRLSERGISLFQVSRALQDNNVTAPSGAITEDGQTFPVRTTATYGSIEEIRGLVVGFGRIASSGGAQGMEGSGEAAEPTTPVLLSDVADVGLGTGSFSSISRTNGKPSIGIGVLKEPDANTVDVSSGVLEALAALPRLPEDVEIATISNDGPEIQAQVDNLQREGVLGFFFAMAVVFVFLVTLRPSLKRGLLLTLRPTLVIGFSIPLSIMLGILFMASQGMSLNLMTLGGLAISVGRVVDDSIVVLENVYRHLQRGEDRWKVAFEATREVGPAITASTLTTIVVFVPLGFIQGLVGSFFLPFAITVSMALGASLLVALTAVPVLGAFLLRTADLPSEGAGDGEQPERETWMQRAYTPALLWALRHKAATLIAAVVLTLGSLGLIALIPITLFPSGGQRFAAVQLELPPGTALEETLSEVEQVEGVLSRLADEGIVDVYHTTVGSPTDIFGPGGTSGAGGFSRAFIFIRLSRAAPKEIVEVLREQLESDARRTITVTEIGNGPPTSDLEVSVSGPDYAAVSAVARRLAADIGDIDGIVNVSSDVTEARDEIVITVRPIEVASLGLTARDVAHQVNLFLVGQTVTQIDLGGGRVDVRVRGRPGDVDSIDKIKGLAITGPLGSRGLGEVADVTLEKGPVSISRSDGRRSASITGNITEEDTRGVGRKVQSRIDAIDLPPGVEVNTGGIFQQIAEGFEDIFLSMGIGVLLVYLVMVASLGALRNPFVIIMSLPLALIGALASLAITGRTLGLPAMMGVLLLVGIVVTNAIVLIAFVEQLRERGMSIHEALVHGGRIRLRPILMTAFTTSFALLPLAVFVGDGGGIIGAELATVVIGGLVSSAFLTLIVVPVLYTLMHETLPRLFGSVGSAMRRA